MHAAACKRPLRLLWTAATWGALRLVPQEADIVFIEYTINDMLHNTDIRGAELKEDFYKVETGLRRGLERLFRKLLAYPRAPAVLLVHSWAPAISVHNWVEAPVHNYFHTTPEDLMDVVAKCAHPLVLGSALRSAQRTRHACPS